MNRRERADVSEPRLQYSIVSFEKVGCSGSRLSSPYIEMHEP